MDSNQFDVVKKFQQFFQHMDKTCQQFLTGQKISTTSPATKEHKKKDPNAPKRGLSAFFFFSNLYREKILQRQPNIKMPEIAQLCGSKWGSMSEEDKKPYVELSNKDKERYESEYTLYCNDNGLEKVLTKKQKKQQKHDEKSKAGETGESAGESEVHVPLVKPSQHVQKPQEKKKPSKVKEVSRSPSPVKVTKKTKVTEKVTVPKVKPTKHVVDVDDDEMAKEIQNFLSNKDSPQKHTVTVKKNKK